MARRKAQTDLDEDLREDEEEVPPAHKKKKKAKNSTARRQPAKKNGGKKPYRRGDLGRAVMELIDKHNGPDDITYDEAEALAKKILPDTKFNASHWSWYKNKWFRDQEAAEAAAKRKSGKRK